MFSVLKRLHQGQFCYLYYRCGYSIGQANRSARFHTSMYVLAVLIVGMICGAILSTQYYFLEIGRYAGAALLAAIVVVGMIITPRWVGPHLPTLSDQFNDDQQRRAIRLYYGSLVVVVFGTITTVLAAGYVVTQ